ncbi:MAG: fibrobacter succinogenes major paralogous domain-containing protein [Cryomorphaceae bacterium]|nr:fibrobacter succinogenes major paralogous domain-containing protein [Cryomorphaceae bacterium]
MRNYNIINLFRGISFPLLSLVLIVGCGKDDEDDKPKKGGKKLECQSTISIEEITFFSAEVHLAWDCEVEPKVQNIGVIYAVGKEPSEGDSIVWADEIIEKQMVVLGDLQAESTYLVKMVIESKGDRWYSSAKSFTTEAAPTYVYDIENNQYPTVFISGREWMAENLRTTKYNDGVPIIQITNLFYWPNDSVGVFSHYNHSSVHSLVAGVFYNWVAVNTGKLCPQGWSVPTAQEFVELSDYLGGDAVSGGALKKMNTAYWTEPNRDAANTHGFSAVGSGMIYHEFFGSFASRNIIGPLWSSTEFDASRANYRLLHYNDGHFISKRGKKTHGMCVRCLKDE